MRVRQRAAPAVREDDGVRATSESDHATRTLRWADVAVGIVALVAVSLAALAPVRAEGIALVVASMLGLAVLWLRMRGPLAATGTAPAWRVVGLAAVAFACTLAAPWLAIVQAVLHPLAWIGAERRRYGVASSGVVAAAAAAGWIVHSPDDGWAAVATQAGSWAFSVWFGLWIGSIDRLSEERQRLVEALRASQDEVAALASEQGARLERDRIAREVHDTIAQDLAGVVMLLEGARASADGAAAAALERAEQAARRSLADARALVAGEIAIDVEGRGLATSLSELAARFAREHDVAVDARVDAVATGREAEVVLVRSLQEALSNVRRHAGAHVVHVSLAADGADAVLHVDDDGIGMPAARPATAGFGLDAMARRAALADGSATTSSSPLGGTRVAVRVPLVAREEPS